MGALADRRAELGLELDAVATELRIPAAHLLAIELGEFSKLPEGPYATGWIRTYAAHLNVDAEPILAVAAAQSSAGPTPLPMGAVRGAAGLMALVLAVLVGWQLSTLSSSPNPGDVVNVADADLPDQHLRLRIERGGRFVVLVDGEQVLDRALRPGEDLRFSGHERLELQLPAAESARVEYNGELVVPQGRQDVPRRLVFIDDSDGG